MLPVAQCTANSIYNFNKLNCKMSTAKPKYVYSVTAYDDATATAVYSCLKTACEQWDLLAHYSTIWKWLRRKDTPYQDSKITIKKHLLIRSHYERH